ncbi:unnamed protein product [Closterium sp. NIES-53]
MAAGKGTSAESPNRVDRGQVERAVQSLVKWMTARRKAKSEHELFAEDDDELIHVVIGLKSSPDFAKTSGFRLPIPHSLYPLDAGKEVCLLVNDDPKGGHKKSKENFLKQVSASFRERGFTLTGLWGSRGLRMVLLLCVRNKRVTDVSEFSLQTGMAARVLRGYRRSLEGR